MSEAREQEVVVRWCELHGIPVFHIPNGGSRNKAEAANLRRQGVKAGVPDLCVPVARGGFHGLFIEMKDVDGRPPRKTQREWLGLLSDNGYAAGWAKGAGEAIDMVKEYMGL